MVGVRGFAGEISAAQRRESRKSNASYSFLTHLLAKHCGLVADEFVHFLGDAHIYESHVESLKMQIERIPLEFPRINIKSVKPGIEEYDLEDIEFVEQYLHHPKIEMDMVA